MGGWVDCEAPVGDRLPAFRAPTIFAFTHALQGDLDPRQIARPPPRFGLGHFLLLHRVHARQAPDALLIELDRIAPAGTLLVQRLQFGLAVEQPLLQIFELRRGKLFSQYYCVFGASRSSAAAVIASVPSVTDSLGAILKKGEWWEGTGGPPAFSRSKSACGVPPTEK